MDYSSTYTGVYRSPTKERTRNTLRVEKLGPCPDSPQTAKYDQIAFRGYREQRDTCESGYNSTRDTSEREREGSLDDELCLRQGCSVNDDSGVRSFGVANE